MDSFHSLEVSPLIKPSGFSVTRAGPGLGPPPLAVAAGTKIMGRNGLHAGHSSRSSLLGRVGELVSQPPPPCPPPVSPSLWGCHQKPRGRLEGPDFNAATSHVGASASYSRKSKRNFKKIKIFFKKQTFDIVLYLNTVLNLLD